MPLGTRTKDSAREERGDRKTYSFSSLVASVFMLAMVLVSGLVIMTSYIGTQDIIRQSISQLSDRIKLIASLTFDEYVQRTANVEKSLTRRYACFCHDGKEQGAAGKIFI